MLAAITGAAQFALRFAEAAEDHGSDEAPNPILPATDEIVWGTISFLVIFFLLAKLALPAIKKGLDARSEKIQGDIDAAESARTEAQSLLADYQAQLANSRSEANRILDEARQQAETVRRDVLARAEAEAAQVRAKATEDLTIQAERIKAELEGHVKRLSLDLAEKVVGANLNTDTNAALIDRYIAELGAK